MGSVVRYCETSMRNGFGLKYIHQFLNIPFLQLQRECLLQQLQINAQDMDKSLEEIDSYAESDDNNYDLFIDMLANKRRTKQEELAADILVKAKPLEEAKRLHDEALAAATAVEQEQQAKSTPLNTIVQVIKKTTEATPSTIKLTPTTKQKPPIVAVQPIVQQATTKSIVPNESVLVVSNKPRSSDDFTETQISNPLVASTVDDFVPDDNDYETFLVDDPVPSTQDYLPIDSLNKSFATKLSTTDDENDVAINPMVKGFCERLDSDDEQQQATMSVNQQIEYEKPEPESIVPLSVNTNTRSITSPVYHQITSSDLDFLDQLSATKQQQAISEPSTFDSQSIHSDSASTKSKKKKTTTKSKKETTVATSETTKTKKKKKSSSMKTPVSATIDSPITNTNDDDDLESFLADNSTSNKHNQDYEDV